MNCDEKPSQTYDKFWLHEISSLNSRSNEYPSSESGKWMTFHPTDQIDEAWERAKQLYRTGQLPEVRAMKVATVAPNPVYANRPQTTKVICFYCGPASNKQKMLAIGRTIAEGIDYQARTISYKTDQQTGAGVRGSTYTIVLE